MTRSEIASGGNVLWWSSIAFAVVYNKLEGILVPVRAEDEKL